MLLDSPIQNNCKIYFAYYICFYIVSPNGCFMRDMTSAGPVLIAILRMLAEFQSIWHLVINVLLALICQANRMTLASTVSKISAFKNFPMKMHWESNLPLPRPRSTWEHDLNKLGRALHQCYIPRPNGPRREKTCLRRFANNTGADQPAHPRSLISAFVIRLLESIISKLATSEISVF